MEVTRALIQHYAENYFYPSSHLLAYNSSPQNHVHWSQNPESHVYSADIPGVRKEEIRVEVEDSRYVIIRTEATAERSFNRKFRLPEQVDVDGISADYVAGVLTIKVPRSSVRRGIFVDPADRPESVPSLASAA